MKPGFLEKLLKRLDHLDPEEMQHYLLRLVQEQGFFQKVFEALQEGLILLDKERVVTYANRAACEFFGIERSAILGRRLGEGVRGLDLESLAKSRCSISRDFEVQYPISRSLNFYLSPIGEQEDLGFVVLIRDQTESLKLTEERIESDRLSTLTLLAAAVAHELGNPLNSLTIHLQLIERRLRKFKSKEAEKILEMLSIPQDEVRRLDSMISQFLGAIRPSRPVCVTVDINGLLQESLVLLRPELKKVKAKIEVDLAVGLPPLNLDPSQMKQVFYNLIKNAVQATSAGGNLIIQTRRDSSSVEIIFRDSGKGIAKEEMGNLFRPFNTTRNGGNGLGLLVVRRIVREHGGEMEIRSGAMQGTTVTINFPLQVNKPLLLAGSV